MKKETIYRGNIPFVRLLLFFILGILLGYHIEPDVRIYRSLIIILLVVCIAFISTHLLIKQHQSSYYAGLVFLFGTTILGWLFLWKSDPKIQKSHFSHFKTEALIGIVNEEPKHTGEYLHFEFKVNGGYEESKRDVMNGLLLINLRIDSTISNNLEYGDLLIIPAHYFEVSPPYNPGEFNYKAFLANKNIWHSSFLNREQIKIIGKKKGSYIIQHAIDLRQRMLRKFEKYLLDKNTLSIASALVLGYRHDMEKETLTVFTDTGTVHVLAVSGLHVGIVFVVFSTLLFWMDRNPKVKFMKGIVLIVLIWFYALITGFSPSVLRAAIMISFSLVTLYFMKGGNIYNTIAASALMLLFFNPKFIAHVGFQLSYLAVIAIIYLYPRLRNLVHIKSPMLKWLWSYSALSIAAQLITFPLVVYYFDIFPLYFLPANVFVIMPATFIVYLGFILLIVPSGTSAVLVSKILEGLISITNGTLEYFAQLPLATINNFSISSWQVILIYCLILSMVFAFTLKKRQLIYWGLFFVILLASQGIQKYSKSKKRGEVKVYNVNRSLAIGLFKKDERVLYVDSLFLTSKNFQYFLRNVERNEKGKVTIICSPDSYRSSNLLIEKNIVQLEGKRIFIYDKTLSLEGTLLVDVLLIKNNRNESLKDIHNSIKFKKVLIDGSNSDNRIKLYIEEAEKLSIPFYVLKNNFAYVW